MAHGNHHHRPRYNGIAQALHWLIALAVIAAIVFIELHGQFPKGSEPRELVKHIHFQLGLAAFLLVWLRLAWRAGRTPPPITPPPRGWENALAAVMHVALYLALIALPILGFASLQAKGDTVVFLGIELPQLLAKNPELGKTLKQGHERIGSIVIWLIVLHVVATAWHHHIRHDDTLTRMLPDALAARLGKKT